MGLNVKWGEFSSPTATGSQSITGVGFQPKCVIFYSAGIASSAVTTAVSQFSVLGWASSSTEEGAIATWNQDALTTTEAGRRQVTTACITGTNTSTGSVFFQADLTSFDAGGFTLNWTTVDTSARRLYYLALGGDVQAKADSFNWPGTTGNVSVTGVGFKPDLILFAQTGGNGSTAYHAIGFAKSSTERHALETYGANAQTTTIERKRRLTNRCKQRETNTTVFTEGDFVSMDNDGFTVNVITTGSTAAVLYLALGYVEAKIGTVTAPTTTGNQSYTGVGFQPSALCLTSALGTSSTLVAEARLAYGWGTSSTAQGTVEYTADDGVTTTECNRGQDNTKILKGYNAARGLLNAADLVSMNTDGFTLNWTTANATQFLWSYLALGPKQTFVYDASGRLLFNGLAGSRVSALVEASGRLNLTGLAEVQATYAYLAGGRLTLDGLAVSQATYDYPAGGRLTLDGLASVSATYAYRAGGLLFLSGEADVTSSVGRLHQASGKLLFSGLAGVQASYAYLAGGRLLLDGLADLRRGFPFDASGLLLLSGIAGLSGSVSFEASGKLVFGGVFGATNGTEPSEPICLTYTVRISDLMKGEVTVKDQYTAHVHVC